jgi:hypothetical protein
VTIDDRFRRRLWLYRVSSVVCAVMLAVVNQHAAYWLGGAVAGFLGGWAFATFRYSSWKLYRVLSEQRLARIGRYEDFPTARQRLHDGELFVLFSLFPYRWIGVVACVVPIGVLGYLTRLDRLRSREAAD